MIKIFVLRGILVRKRVQLPEWNATVKPAKEILCRIVLEGCEFRHSWATCCNKQQGFRFLGPQCNMTSKVAGELLQSLLMRILMSRSLHAALLLAHAASHALCRSLP